MSVETVYQDGQATLLLGDVRAALRTLPSVSVHVCVTSPPYHGLRDYGLAPSVWGGREECEHEWQTQYRRGQTGGDGQTSTLNAKYAHDGRFAGDSKAHLQTAATLVSATCVHCHAWRGCLGLEPEPDCLAWARQEPPCGHCFVCNLRTVFSEVRRVLRDDGVIALNLGDSYAGSWGAQGRNGEMSDRSAVSARQIAAAPRKGSHTGAIPKGAGLKPKDLIMIPARVALALQADGWWLRSAITWVKLSAMPESVSDRPSQCTEQIFLLAKSARYYWDAEAVKEESVALENRGGNRCMEHAEGIVLGRKTAPHSGLGAHRLPAPTRNLRNAWILGPEPTPFQHFATMPTEIPRRAIAAGSPERCCAECGKGWRRVVERSNPTKLAVGGKLAAVKANGDRNDGNARMGDPASITLGWQPACACNAGVKPAVVLDPFVGSGTTLLVAKELGRHGIGIDANAEYLKLATERIRQLFLPLEGL